MFGRAGNSNTARLSLNKSFGITKHSTDNGRRGYTQTNYIMQKMSKI